MGERRKDAYRLDPGAPGLKVEFHASQSHQRCRLMMQSVCPLILLCVMRIAIFLYSTTAMVLLTWP